MAKVQAKPEQYHSVTPSIMFDDCSAAIEFYKKAFGAQELSRMAGPNGRIMHAEIKVGDSVVMMGDTMPGMGARSARELGGSPISLHVYVENVDARWKQAVSAGAKEMMPLSEQFWGDRYGVLVDPFGIQWSLAQHVRDVTDEEIRQAVKKMPPPPPSQPSVH